MKNIDEILNNYFDGIATSDEEKALKNYFRSGEIHPRHAMYKPLFDTFEEEKSVTAPAFIIPKEKTEKKTIIPPKLWTLVSSIAAALLLALILFPFNRKTDNKSEYMVYLNGTKITNQQQAKAHADRMFEQVDEMIAEAYQPFVEAKAMQQEMDADLMFKNLYQQMNNSSNQ